MCCDVPDFELPESIQEMVAQYRLRIGAPVDRWGLDAWASPAAATGEELAGDARFRRAVGVRQASMAGSASLEDLYGPDAVGVVVRDALGGRIPPGLGVVTVLGNAVRLDSGAPRSHLPGRPARAWLMVDSSVGRSVPVRVGDSERVVPPRGALLVEVAPGTLSSVDGHPVAVESLFTRSEPAVLSLRALALSRWSVVDERGWGWFPQGCLEKYDYHGRPFFHAGEVNLPVPSGRLEVSVTRGIGWTTERETLSVEPGEQRTVEMAPGIRFDPGEKGWYGADLHVHMNYGGNQVCEPADAARMQVGEGLDFMSLLAANISTALVYDREALEAWPERDLPWSGAKYRARMGVEYRNDLLGHFHVTAPAGRPERFASGHGNRPDWPPNSEVAREYRAAGATVGYCHPVYPESIPWQPGAVHDADPLDRVMRRTNPRNVEAREIVADAALGLVDSLDVVSNADDRAGAVLYRRLLGTGLRLAATAGTDAMLSVRHSGVRSNPPGWSRVYVRAGEHLDADSLKAAIRRCETIATNGPWIEFDVGGRGPGSTIAARPGERLPVIVRAVGPGADRPSLVTAHGPVVMLDSGAGWTAEVEIHESTYLLATVEGDPHPEVLAPLPFAITSPVWVEIDGKPVCVEEDVRWCLRWLDELERVVGEHGRFEVAAQRSDLIRTIDQARSSYQARLDG